MQYTEFSRQKVLRIALFVYSYVYAIDFFFKITFSVNKTDVHVSVLSFIELFDFVHIQIPLRLSH